MDVAAADAAPLRSDLDESRPALGFVDVVDADVAVAVVSNSAHDARSLCSAPSSPPSTVPEATIVVVVFADRTIVRHTHGVKRTCRQIVGATG